MQMNLSLRLTVLRVLVFALLATLGARLYYLQVLDTSKLTQTANRQHTRQIVLPAERGAIVDDRGRPLVRNRLSLVVSVNRSQLIAAPDGGRAALTRLSRLVGIPPARLAKRITPCAPNVPTPCWNGSPYQPVPVLTDTAPNVVLQISEHREDFPGVTAEARTLRSYPNHSLAAHTIGYIGPVTAEELDSAAATGNTNLHQDDLVGRSGLEASYDVELRGTDGIQYVTVDNRGTVLGNAGLTPPTTGETLVTSLDQRVQAVAEKALADEVALRRTQLDPSTNRPFEATSAAVVVLDPGTGRVIAMASYPSYDPTLFVGGISQAQLNQLTNPAAGAPLVSRAVAGQFAPGSTFKLASASAELMTGRASTSGGYPCPGSLKVGNQTKTNFDSESIGGDITVARALSFSCDTFFYAFAMQDWTDDEARVAAGQRPVEALQRYARAFGFGSPPGVDLPAGEQTAGQIVDRAFLKHRWDQNKAQYCADGRRGYPEVADPERRGFLTLLAQQNCTDGWRFNIGDAADLAIGQGETTVSPLQLAVAYSALVNGGTVWAPTIGRAVVAPDGKVVRQITAKARGRVPVSPDVLTYIRDSLAFTPQNSPSGNVAFTGFPLDQVLVGGKTGTAQVFGKQDTSWFASWAPAQNPRFVVAAMVEQAGLGSGAAAPIARKVYEGLFGVDGQPAALPGGQLPSGLPALTAATATGAGAGSPAVGGAQQRPVGSSPGSSGAGRQGEPSLPAALPAGSPTPSRRPRHRGGRPVPRPDPRGGVPR